MNSWPAHVVHLGLERRRRSLERVGDRLQLVAVDADAGHLHLGQDPHERRLDVVVQHDHVLGRQALAEPHRHGGDVVGLSGRLLRYVVRRLSRLEDVEGQLTRLLAELRQLVLARRRIEQIGGHGGVHLEPGDVDAEWQQRPHDLLDVVTQDGAAKEAVQLLGDRSGHEQLSGYHHADSRLVALGRDEDQGDQGAAAGHAVPAGRQRQPAGAELGQVLRRFPPPSSAARRSRSSNAGAAGAVGAARWPRPERRPDHRRPW